MVPHDTSSANVPSTITKATTLRLDIVSDTICPWCWVGKRRLTAALPQLEADGIALEATWRPFQLNPAMPKDGADRRAYRSVKFGSWERSQALDAQVAAVGAGDGLEFRHDLMARTPNTLASHVLIRLAHEMGGPALQDRVVEALFAAYFQQGRDVGSHEVLADLAQEAGLDRAQTLAHLAEPANGEAVMLDANLARGLGLNGVPSVVFGGHLLFSGAQPTSVIVRTLRQAARGQNARNLTQAAPAGAGHALT